MKTCFLRLSACSGRRHSIEACPPTGATGLVGSASLRRLTPPASPSAASCAIRVAGADRVRVQIALGDLADPPLFRTLCVGFARSWTSRRRSATSAPDRSRSSTGSRRGAWCRPPSARAPAFRLLQLARRREPRSHAGLRAKALPSARRWPPTCVTVFAPSLVYAPAIACYAHRAHALVARRAAQRARPGAVPADLGRRRRRLRHGRAFRAWRGGGPSATSSPARRRCAHRQIVELVLAAAGRTRPMVSVPSQLVNRVLRAGRDAAEIACAGDVGRGGAAQGVDDERGRDGRRRRPRRHPAADGSRAWVTAPVPVAR